MNSSLESASFYFLLSDHCRLPPNLRILPFHPFFTSSHLCKFIILLLFQLTFHFPPTKFSICINLFFTI
uniref:Uncharacterized protein n=1 Tax=Octopus bimaculoides TaxID=37653 RepID=A0A0L8HGY9_OCTBM